jgi:hypothetical protein
MGTFQVVSTLLTVIAALVALYYARETVRQGRAGQREAHEWRQEDLAERRRAMSDAASARAENLDELRHLKDQAAAAHSEQMHERARAAESDRHIQQLSALDRIVAGLVDLAIVAWNESENPPPPRPLALPPTQLHIVRARLQAPAAVHRALGGRRLTKLDEIVEQLQSYAGGDPANKFIGLAVLALGEVTRVAHPDATA